MIDLTDRANLLECIALLVDAMRRSDPEYTLVHGCEPCSDDDWNAAIEAGEDVIEANECQRGPQAQCNHSDPDKCCGGGHDGPCDCACHPGERPALIGAAWR